MIMRYICWCIYINYSLDCSGFLTDLENIISQCSELAIITGDININLLDNYNCSEYLNLMNFAVFLRFETSYSYIRGNYSSCLDHISVRGIENNLGG